MFSWLGQIWKCEDCYGEMPRIHCAKSVFAHEAQRSILDVLLVSSDDGHHTVHPEVSIQ